VISCTILVAAEKNTKCSTCFTKEKYNTCHSTKKKTAQHVPHKERNHEMQHLYKTGNAALVSQRKSKEKNSTAHKEVQHHHQLGQHQLAPRPKKKCNTSTDHISRATSATRAASTRCVHPKWNEEIRSETKV
jgi:hypothetical protein